MLAAWSRGRRYLIIAGLVAWIGFIFCTSCTVVRPQEFFALIHRYCALSEDSLEKFKVFWGISWFAVVKGWHAFEFGMLLMLVTKAVQLWKGTQETRTIGWAMLGCILFAISDEWHQSFIPDRMGTVTDVAIDTLGVVIVGAALVWRQKRVEGYREPAGLATGNDACEAD